MISNSLWPNDENSFSRQQYYSSRREIVRFLKTNLIRSCGQLMYDRPCTQKNVLGCGPNKSWNVRIRKWTNVPYHNTNPRCGICGLGFYDGVVFPFRWLAHIDSQLFWSLRILRKKKKEKREAVIDQFWDGDMAWLLMSVHGIRSKLYFMAISIISMPFQR